MAMEIDERRTAEVTVLAWTEKSGERREPELNWGTGASPAYQHHPTRKTLENK